MSVNPFKPMCAKCGYELAGLRVEEQCPECGTPIWCSHPSLTVPVAKGARAAQIWGRVAMAAMLFPFAAFLFWIGWFITIPAAWIVMILSAFAAITFGRRVQRDAKRAGIHAIGIPAALHGQRMGYVVLGILAIELSAAAYLFILNN